MLESTVKRRTWPVPPGQARCVQQRKQESMRTVAIADPYSTGHHPTYIRLYAQELLALGYRVFAFCADPDAAVGWIRHYSGARAHDFRAFPLPEVAGHESPRFYRVASILTQARKWSTLERSVRRAERETGTRVDFVFVTYLDDYIMRYFAPCMLFPLVRRQWSGLFFHPFEFLLPDPAEHRRLGTYRWRRRLLTARSCTSVALLVHTVADELSAQIGGKPVFAFPDVADPVPPDRTLEIVQDIRRLAAGRKTVCLVGSLDARKNFALLLDIALLAPAMGKHWFFVFAGQFHEHTFSAETLRRIKALMDYGPGNCFFHCQRLPDEAAFNGVIDASDAMFAAYDSFAFSSNMLAKAALLAKPLLVTKGCYMGDQVERYGLGLAIGNGNITAGIRALERLLDSGEFDAVRMQPKYDAYLADHSLPQLRRVLQEVVALGLGRQG